MEERRLAERRRAEERRRLLDRRANGDDGGNGAQPPAHGNGSEQDLQVYAEAQLEHFREHQRRHRHRFWK
jgi:hypothetical protein